MNTSDISSKETNAPLIDVKNLVVHYETDDGVVEAVNNVSFQLNRGETLGLVGETGAGKTTIALSLMRLLPVPPSHVIQGSIALEGEDLMSKSEKEMRKIRGRKISMIFQGDRFLFSCPWAGQRRLYVPYYTIILSIIVSALSMRGLVPAGGSPRIHAGFL